jgi:DNA-binding IclR family transcriptional regulator
LAPGDLLTRAAERLISQHIDSVGALDLLLLLHEGRDRDWSIQELCRTLRCPDGWAEEQLARLAAIGLVAADEGRYRYTRGRQYGPAVDQIARACRHDRAAVTKLVFARARRGSGQFAG